MTKEEERQTLKRLEELEELGYGLEDARSDISTAFNYLKEANKTLKKAGIDSLAGAIIDLKNVIDQARAKQAELRTEGKAVKKLLPKLK